MIDESLRQPAYKLN